MDDLSEKLAQILNDPESMNRVRQMAENLLGNQDDQTGNEAQPQVNQNANNNSSDIFSMLNANEISTIVNIISRLKSSGNDSRTQLLMALRPHLSEPRREKVDTAIKILKLLDLLPFLKESGILKNLI